MYISNHFLFMLVIFNVFLLIGLTCKNVDITTNGSSEVSVAMTTMADVLVYRFKKTDSYFYKFILLTVKKVKGCFFCLLCPGQLRVTSL